MRIKLGLLPAWQVLGTLLHPHPSWGNCGLTGENVVHLARKVILLMLDFPKTGHNNNSPSTLWCIWNESLKWALNFALPALSSPSQLTCWPPAKVCPFKKKIALNVLRKHIASECLGRDMKANVWTQVPIGSGLITWKAGVLLALL